jgi:acyl-coenzyme A synthetase/AMP-(fatty) acid ligase
MIRVVDELPVNRAGKVQRKALAALISEPTDNPGHLSS